jgi:hypothetical protein
MNLRLLLASVTMLGWGCSGTSADNLVCSDVSDQLQICLGSPTFTCGAAGQNTTVSYRRTVNDHGAIQSDLFLFVMWEVPSQLENYTAGPEDDLIATHVYDVPGTYELWFRLAHGDGAPVGGIATLNCFFDEEDCDSPYYVVIANDGCSIIGALNYTVGAEANTNEASGSRQNSLPYFVWLAFAVLVGMSTLDIVT